jgi:hypothetical protein
MKERPTPKEVLRGQESEKIDNIKKELQDYADQYGLHGLENRIQRGIDPAGMLAVHEIRSKIEQIAKALDAPMNDVIQLTNELHQGAVWKNADALKAGEKPDIKMWIATAAISLKEREKEGDMSEKEFLEDLKRINLLLDEAIQNPEEFLSNSKNTLIEQSRTHFEIEDGIPISELDSGFLSMAVNGYKSGIIRDKEGLLFVGADELDYESLGLVKHVKEDRGREVEFYVQNNQDAVKKLYPGFAIVFNEDIELAKKLARSAIETELPE